MKLVLPALVFAAFTLGLAPSSSAAAEEPRRWYYSAFGSPDMEARVFIRSGAATILKSSTNVDIVFHEQGGFSAKFVGVVTGSSVKGRLSDFHASSNEVLKGTYKRLKVGSCQFEEIALFNGVPDGGILMISRISGHCQ